MAPSRTPSAPAKRAAPVEPAPVPDVLINLLTEAVSTLRDLRSDLQAIAARLEALAAHPAPAAPPADDYAPGRDHDPGDAVPEGVAPLEPVPLTPQDEQVLHTLEELPRAARKRAPARPRR